MTFSSNVLRVGGMLKPITASAKHVSRFSTLHNRLGASSVPKCFLLSRPHASIKHCFTPCSVAPLPVCVKRTFCTEKKESSIKGLADEILRSKMAPSSSSTAPEVERAKAEKEEEDRRKADEFQMRAMKWTFVSLGLSLCFGGGFLISDWGAPRRDEDGNIIEDEFTPCGGMNIIFDEKCRHLDRDLNTEPFSNPGRVPTWQAHLKRSWKELRLYTKAIQDPSREKLLPEPLTEPYYQPPYTLVLELTGILVHPDWTYQTGWRFKKRPGVEFFLSQVGPPLYEVVIYTAEQGFTAFPIIDSLDPQGYVMYRLFRDATRYMDGHHVKDLGCLNRDLSKVIFVDWNPKSFQLQPRNAFKLKKWAGNDDDRTLVDLAIFLKTVAESGVKDVRSVLEYYAQFDDPLEAFKQNQRLLQEEEAKRQKALAESKESVPLAKSWAMNRFRR